MGREGLGCECVNRDKWIAIGIATGLLIRLLLT